MPLASVELARRDAIWGAHSALVHKVTPAADDQVAIVVDWVRA